MKKVAVFFLLYTDVFSSDSSVTQYNQAVDRIKTDQRCVDVLGPGNEISALGEPTGTSWIRQRPRARVETDVHGTERMHMKFQVHGPKNKGSVTLHMFRRQDEKHYNYGQLFLDVVGQSRIFLENGDQKAKAKKTPGTIFGIRWR